jgi:acetyl/propionyl-CoA carboxylase alpha subunit
MLRKILIANRSETVRIIRACAEMGILIGYFYVVHIFRGESANPDEVLIEFEPLG